MFKSIHVLLVLLISTLSTYAQDELVFRTTSIVSLNDGYYVFKKPITEGIEDIDEIEKGNLFEQKINSRLDSINLIDSCEYEKHFTERRFIVDTSGYEVSTLISFQHVRPQYKIIHEWEYDFNRKKFNRNLLSASQVWSYSKGDTINYSNNEEYVRENHPNSFVPNLILEQDSVFTNGYQLNVTNEYNNNSLEQIINNTDISLSIGDTDRFDFNTIEYVKGDSTMLYKIFWSDVWSGETEIYSCHQERSKLDIIITHEEIDIDTIKPGTSPKFKNYNIWVESVWYFDEKSESIGSQLLSFCISKKHQFRREDEKHYSYQIKNSNK